MSDPTKKTHNIGDKESPFSVMVDAATTAGTLLKQHFHSGNTKVFQKAPYDPVTEADIEAETVIKEILSHARPSCGFFSEESGMTHDLDATSRWMIDPLDGTRNFSRGIPCYATLIALQEKNKNGVFCTTAGIICIPESNVVYYAEKDCGAITLDSSGRKTILSLLSEHDRPDHMISLSARDVLQPQIMPILKTPSFKFRDSGCTGFALAMVADGKADGLISYNVNPWDICAGGLIIREAGGIASVPGRCEDPCIGDTFIAATQRTYRAICKKGNF